MRVCTSELLIISAMRATILTPLDSLEVKDSGEDVFIFTCLTVFAKIVLLYLSSISIVKQEDKCRSHATCFKTETSF